MDKQRISRVIGLMQQMHLSQTLISSPASVFYLTGKWIYPGERMLAVLLKDNGEIKLFANRLFALNGTIDIPLVEYDDTEDCVALLADTLSSGYVGIDKDLPSRFTIRLIEKRSDIKPIIGSPCVDGARLCKDYNEIDLMRESSLKNDEAIQKTS